jgi:glycosyltransferase involved in cell wall biosynthesis
VFFPKVAIIFPGHLEAMTLRGGGRESRLLHVGLELGYSILYLAPFFGEYQKEIIIKNNKRVRPLFFPASKIYPSDSNFTKVMDVLSIFIFSLQASIALLLFKKNSLKVAIFGDFLSGVIPAICAKCLGLKVIFYEGNVTPWANPFVSSKTNSTSQRIMDCLIFLSAEISSKLSDSIIVNDGLIEKTMKKKWGNRVRISVIRGIVETEKFKPSELKAHNDNFVVAFNGRLTQEKGVSSLLEVCNLALNKLPHVKFMLLGDGPYKQALAALPNVTFIGQIPHSHINSKLSEADVVISFQKTFGMGEVEALSCGKPIIASKIGEMPTLLKHMETGFLCESTADSYLQAISFLSKNASVCDFLSVNSRKQALAMFDSKVISKQWETIIKTTLSTSR